jgi:hypothetical protein
MPAEFDPYYTWLGIPPEEQPPHHYRLLGIRPLEADRDVITHAMDQRMAHLRTMQGGKHSEHSQRLLNEVSAAAVVLLDRAKKEPYDAALKQQLTQAAEASPAVVPPPPPAAVKLPENITPPPLASKKPALALPLIAAGAVAGGLAALVLLLIAMIIVVRVWTKPDEIASTDRPRRDGALQHTTTEPAGESLEKNPPPPDFTVERPAAAPDTSFHEPPLPPMPTGRKSRREKSPLPDEPANARVGTATPATIAPAPDPTTETPPTIVATTPQESPPQAAAQPSPEEIEAARGRIGEVFGSEAGQATRPDDKLALAQKMVQVARETSSDRAARFVLLDEARKLQAAAGDAEQALATISSLADEFDGDLRELQRTTLSAMSDATLPTEKRDQLAAALLTLINQSVAEEEFAIAEEFAKLAVKVSTRGGDVNLRRAIVQKRADLTRLKDQFHAVEQARQKLASDVGDPAANLVVGKFLCFAVADFEQGVPHLALSQKEPYAAAARADQAAEQRDSAAALKAGDAWYSLAEAVKTSDKELLPGALVRTRHWYELALPQLAGLDKARVEKRLQEIGLVAAPPRLPQSENSPAKAKGKKGKRKAKPPQ